MKTKNEDERDFHTRTLSFQRFYLSTFVLISCLTFSHSTKFKIITDLDLVPGLDKAVIYFIRIKFKTILEYLFFYVSSR